MYKDPEKQKELNRRKQKAYRLRKKGVTQGVTERVTKGVTLPEEGVTGVTQLSNAHVTPEFIEGMKKWTSLRGKAMRQTALVAPTEKLDAKKAVLTKTEPPAWRAQKNAQMERFLKGNK